jgi:hypothetical protein
MSGMIRTRMHSPRTSWLVRSLALAVLGLAVTAVPAQATFHEIKVREVATNPAGANSSYVELQMYSQGQNLVGTHQLISYTATGTLLGTSTIPSNVTNGQNQRTVLIGGPAAPGSPDYVDAVFPTYFSTISAGGAVCWETLDCVSWGNFSGSLGSPTGTPAAAIPNGSALRRSICAGNPTLLEAGDDTNNSAADFSLVAPDPHNNASPITEAPCPGGGGDNDRPNTKIKKRPKNRSDDTSPTFKFKSTETGSKFKCKLDRKKFRKCKSPKTYHGLDPGKHTFKVKAIDADGNVDKTPAKDGFKVLP